MKMNISDMNSKRAAGGFTLIEMIGVLAVIAILAALLLPKVANAINDSKINSAVGTYQSICAATTGFYTKNLAFNMAGSPVTNIPLTTATAPYLGYDTNALVVAGFLDHPFTVKVGTNAYVSLTTGYGTTPGDSLGKANNGSGYALGGGTTPTTTNMQYVVECVIGGVSPQDANAISQLVDGPTGTPTGIGTTDAQGKVTWSSTTQTMYLFVDGR